MSKAMYLDKSVGLGAGVGGLLTRSTPSAPPGGLRIGSPDCGGVDGAGVGKGAGTCRICIGSGLPDRYVESTFTDVRLGFGLSIIG
jgi:hypothetical protein